MRPEKPPYPTPDAPPRRRPQPPAALTAAALLGGSPAQAARVRRRSWTSGLNSSGQLGNGGTTSRTSFGRRAQPAPTSSTWPAAASTPSPSLANGTVRTWGEGSKGAIGDGGSHSTGPRP